VTPRFSVVVPTFQRRDVVVASVAAFGAQDFGEPFEVVVVVDGSTDGTADALRALSPPFPLAVVEQENRGPAAARNRGAEEARGEFLLFLDDDMDPVPDFVGAHVRAHRDAVGLVAVAGRILPGGAVAHSMRSLSESSPRRRRELTVPRGSSSSSAISPGVYSSR